MYQCNQKNCIRSSDGHSDGMCGTCRHELRTVVGDVGNMTRSAILGSKENPFGISPKPEKPSNSVLYPKYFKPLHGMDSIDVYGVHQIFDLNDPSGALQHASKKILLSGVRTGGKSKHKDIKEARDALNRWLELNPE